MSSQKKCHLCVKCGEETGSRKRKYCDPCREIFFSAGQADGKARSKIAADALRWDDEVMKAKAAARKKYAFWTNGTYGQQTNQGYAISQPGTWQ